MIDISVFMALCAIVILANAIAIPKVLDYSGTYKNTRARKIAYLSTLTKSTLLSLGACAVGAYMAPRVGLGAPFLHDLLDINTPIPNLWTPLKTALINSIYVLIGLMLLHIVFVQRHITATRYFSLPLVPKILLEGVVEEVVYRWGLMSVVARILVREFNIDLSAAMIIAILLAAVGSSLSHISDLARLHFDRISVALLAIILINFWGALCYGWLFWRYGLTASILCHVMVTAASAATYKMIQNIILFEEPSNGY